LVARVFVLAVVVLFSVCLAAFGAMLAGVAAWALWTGEFAGVIFAAAMTALVLYGAYLFGRVAWRTRRVTVRGQRVRAILIFALVVAVGALAWPAPTEVRVIGLIVAVISVPVWLAEEFEPPKRD
jgi:hypothetical protein